MAQISDGSGADALIKSLLRRVVSEQIHLKTGRRSRGKGRHASVVAFVFEQEFPVEAELGDPLFFVVALALAVEILQPAVGATHCEGSQLTRIWFIL